MRIIKKDYKDNEFIPLLFKAITEDYSAETDEAKLKVIDNFLDAIHGRKYHYQNMTDLPSAPIKTRKLFKVLIFYADSSAALMNMHLTSVLIKNDVFKVIEQNKITKTHLLRYQIENYLNELYVFQEKMEKFLNLLLKECKKKKLEGEIEIMENQKSLLFNSLKELVTARGIHIHHKSKENFINQNVNRNELGGIVEFSIDKVIITGSDSAKVYLKTKVSVINENNVSQTKTIDQPVFTDFVLIDGIWYRKFSELNNKTYGLQ